jgi:ligand-binding sensor domain-containing protein/signal transduction histidine kinase
MPQVDRLAWLFILCLLAASPATLYAERLPLKAYSIEDGLPGALISHIVQDSRGFLWLSTWDGLSRFDGARFVNYGKDDGLPVQHVNGLIETRSGEYWVATNGGGVCRFDPAARVRPQPGAAAASLCRVYTTGETVNSNRVNTLYEDRGGRIWAGTDDGLFRLEPADAQASFQRYEPESVLGIRPGGTRFLEDREGSLWIACGQGLLRVLPSGAAVLYTISPQGDRDQIAALLEDEAGRLWVAHLRAGLLVFRPESITAFASAPRAATVDLRRLKRVRSTRDSVALPTVVGEVAWYTRSDGLADTYVSALQAMPDGRIWMATPGGLTRFDGRRFHVYPTSRALGDHVPRQLGLDRDGNLWIATRASGLLKLPQHGFTTYDRAAGIEGHGIHAIYEDRAGDLYAIGYPWSINRFDGERFAGVTPTALSSGLPAYASPGGLLDSSGHWWFLSTFGLVQFGKLARFDQLGHARPIAIHGRADGLASDSIYRAFEDDRGDLWIATVPGSVNRWIRASGRFESYALPTAGGDRYLTAFAQDRTRALWVGFADGTVMRFREGRFVAVAAPREAAGGFITDFYSDHQGRLWMSTSGAGVWRIDDPTASTPAFRRYGRAEGLSSNNVRCITEDAWGRIYVGTSRGVTRLDPESSAMRHYTTADGLAGDYVMTALRDRYGRLWFGSMTGLSRFDPRDDVADTPPLTLITGLRIAGTPQPMSELGEAHLSLPALDPASNQLEIEYAAPLSEMGRALRFEVMLEGADRAWSEPSRDRRRHYARLGAGEYRFLVRGVTDSGVASVAAASVSFVVLPHWWQRGWVQLTGLSLVALAAYAFQRLRMLRLVEAERLRAHIATDLHDDVGANLSKIAMLSDTVAREAQDLSAAPRSRLSSIGALARESIDGMSDIVWAIDPKRDRFVDLAQRIRHFAEELLEAAGIDLVVDIVHEPSATALDAHSKREILLIAKEALTNAVRHAQCSRVSLELRLAAGWLVLEIADDGCGFEAPSPRSSGGRGLASMRRRAEALGGRVDIRSRAAGGTAVRLHVPSNPRERRRTLV